MYAQRKKHKRSESRDCDHSSNQRVLVENPITLRKDNVRSPSPCQHPADSHRTTHQEIHYESSAGMSPSAIQRKSSKQQWDIPGNVANHIFDGEESGNNLAGLHSEARKNPNNGKLKYSEETSGFRNNSKPYGGKVKAKFGANWSPKNNAYKSSDMFPAGWNESKVTSTIENAYDSTFNYKTNGETIGHKPNWKSGKWLGNASGIAIVFAGHPPSTIYPHR